MKDKNTKYRVIGVLAAISCLAFIAYGTSAPWPFTIPGWLFWGIGLVLETIYIARVGRPDPWETDPSDLLEFDIGMNE